MQKKIYETKLLTCIKCGEEKWIEQKFKHQTNVCIQCYRKQQCAYTKKRAIAKGQRTDVIGRIPYPLEDKWEHLNQKFRSMAKVMINIKDRDEWREQIRKNFAELMQNDEILQWIYAHKEETNKKDKSNPKDLEDTRNIDWDDFEGEEWDD